MEEILLGVGAWNVFVGIRVRGLGGSDCVDRIIR
jgi:hypothetical protein